MHNLHLILQKLADARFEFVVVGGYAAMLHGSSYVTFDLDLCATLSTESIDKLRDTLTDLNPVFSETPEMPATYLRLKTDNGFVDVRHSILGVGDYARVRQNAWELSFFGRRLLVIAIDDLIAAKEAVGREKDLLAVKELRAIKAKRGTLSADSHN